MDFQGNKRDPHSQVRATCKSPGYCQQDDAPPPVPPHTEASSELFQNEPKSNEKLYPSTGQVQTQRQNEVAY